MERLRYTFSQCMSPGPSLMPMVTIFFSDELNERIARAAKLAGITSDALILDAVAERVDTEERFDRFEDTAEQRYGEIVASGETIAWSEMRTFLKDRLVGKKPTRPVPRDRTR
jgi:predicted transcriptional regulator